AVRPALTRVDANCPSRGAARADGRRRRGGPGRTVVVERDSCARRVEVNARDVGQRVTRLLAGGVLPHQRAALDDVDELAGRDVPAARGHGLPGGRHAQYLGLARGAADEIDPRHLADVNRLLFAVVAEVQIAADEVGAVAAMTDQFAALPAAIGQDERRAL